MSKWEEYYYTQIIFDLDSHNPFVPDWYLPVTHPIIIRLNTEKTLFKILRVYYNELDSWLFI